MCLCQILVLLCTCFAMSTKMATNCKPPVVLLYYVALRAILSMHNFKFLIFIILFFSSTSNERKPDFISPVHPGALQKNRKRSYVKLENPGRLSHGYNGLGGHSTVLLPSQAKKIKKVAKPQTVSKFVRTKTNPPLPRM